MPLNTRIVRNGQNLPLRWGDFHVASMALAASFDAGTGPVAGPEMVYETDERRFDCYPDAPFPVTQKIAFVLCSYGALGKTPLNEGSYTLTKRHRFRDLADGEILSLEPGDVLIAVRGW